MALVSHLTLITLVVSGQQVSSGLVVRPELRLLKGAELESLPGLHLLPQGVLTEGVETVPGAPVFSALRHDLRSPPGSSSGHQLSEIKPRQAWPAQQNNNTDFRNPAGVTPAVQEYRTTARQAAAQKYYQPTEL